MALGCKTMWGAHGFPIKDMGEPMTLGCKTMWRAYGFLIKDHGGGQGTWI